MPETRKSRKTRPTISILTPLGFTHGKWNISKDGEISGTKFTKVVNYTGKFAELLAFYKTSPVSNGDGFNDKFFKDKVYTDDNEWVGGSFSKMIQAESDLAAYYDLERKISSTKVLKNMSTKLGEGKVRKRIRDRFDGEYEHDRRWDTEPFMRRSLQQGAKRIVQINCSCGFSSRVSAHEIDRYGAFVAAVTSMIERSGTNVELWASYHGKRFTDSKDSEGHAYSLRIKVKGPDEYLPVQGMLRTLSSVWFRRAVFGLIIQSAEALGKSVKGSLGTPIAYGKEWEIKDNCLNIYSVPSIDEQLKITQNLLKLVGV